MTTRADWGLFGGSREGDETAVACAIREIHEELNINISEQDLREIGTTSSEIRGVSLYEVTVFAAPWKAVYDETFEVLEGAGSLWIDPQELKSGYRLYPIDYSHIEIFENSILSVHA